MSSSSQREPLASLSQNTPPSTRRYVPPKDRKLAPIFIRSLTCTPHASSSQISASSPPEPTTPTSSDQPTPFSPVRKRARLCPGTAGACYGKENEDIGGEERKRGGEVTRYFVPTTPTRAGKRIRVDSGDLELRQKKEVKPDGWVRARRRTGLEAFRGRMTVMDRYTPINPPTPYLSTLIHSLIPFIPTAPPSSILLPSLHPPTGRPRDFSPALACQFSHIAKAHTAASAKEMGMRRLLAVAGEEGGMRVLDVDEPQGVHREEKGWWWRAHANAIFDTKWSSDDSRLMTASGDQTARIHALDGPTPSLIATLRGHTSSVKTSTFFDPCRSASDASQGSVIATGGRDGNILIFDLRCTGRRQENEGADEYGARPTGRERDRYSAGIPGFSPRREGADLDPVMTIKAAHAESGRRVTARSISRSVTSLIALQAMPGVLASAGSADGIVKLWDLRFPAPTARHPERKPICSSAINLPDPTTFGAPTSRRPRGIHSLVESPTTGDIYVLSGDSKIHTLRPSYAYSDEPETAILPQVYSDDNLRASTFFVRMSLSPDGRYLAAGSGKAGVVTFDTQTPRSRGTTLGLGAVVGYWPDGRLREVSAVDWGKDCLAACSDDLVTRVWRSEAIERGMRVGEGEKWGTEWIGAV